MKHVYLLIFFSINAVITPVLSEDKYVFAIKGGISLGSYESGLNWVYIEQLRKLYAKKIATLDTLVGASAGSINVLLSALRFCQKDEVPSSDGYALFQQTWDVGIQDFIDLPESESFDRSLALGGNKQLKTSDREGIFSRVGLRRSLAFVQKQITLSENSPSGSRLRENCAINIGIAVTKLVPDSSLIAGIEVLNQRYIIPIKVIVRNGRLKFFNLNPDNNQFIRQDNYLYLPETQGEVSLEKILDAILASSAFPLVFSPIDLTYCRKLEKTFLSHQSTQCPKGYIEHTAQFIDGGNFNNAPIGAAMKIHDPKEQYNQSVFVLINPSSRRKRGSSTKLSISSHRYNVTTMPGLKEYLKLGYDIFDYGMSAELYQTARRIERLRHASKSDRPSIKITNRYYPVVGDTLFHFGAFFDGLFRQFDFTVGVYDGVINLAEDNCKLKSNTSNLLSRFDCIGIEAKKIVEKLDLKKIDNAFLFEKLAQKEFSNFSSSSSWSWLAQGDVMKINKPIENVFHAIESDDCQNSPGHVDCNETIKVNSFDRFLKKIKHQDDDLNDYEPYSQKIINGKKGWKYPILNLALKRLYEIEENKYLSSKPKSLEQEEQKNIFNALKMSTYVGKTYFSKKEQGLWPNSTLDNARLSMSSLVPDEIGISYRQTSVYMKYKTETLLTNSIYPVGFESRFIPIDWASRTRHVNKMLGAEFVLKYHTSNSIFSTFGVGYGYYNVDFYGDSLNGKLNSFTTPLHGIIFDMGAIAGKIKISFVYRGARINSDNRGYVNWAVNLGLSDIKGLRWLW